jgi:hypothetical protein
MEIPAPAISASAFSGSLLYALPALILYGPANPAAGRHPGCHVLPLGSIRGSPAWAAFRRPRGNAACRSPRLLALSPTSRSSSASGFYRAGRGPVVPTEAGGEFLARIEPVLAAVDEAEHCVREGGDLRGLLRMSMPTDIRSRSPCLSRSTSPASISDRRRRQLGRRRR